MMEKLKDILKKYRFAVLVALAGVVLMLLPAGKQEIEAADTAGEEMSFSLEETERRMAEVLSAMDGVGRVQVMLTLHSGETLSLAEDSSATLGRGAGPGLCQQPAARQRQRRRCAAGEPGADREPGQRQAGGGGHPADVPCLSGCGGGLPGGRRQPCAPAGAGDGVCADRTQQR